MTTGNPWMKNNEQEQGFALRLLSDMLGMVYLEPWRVLGLVLMGSGLGWLVSVYLFR